MAVRNDTPKCHAPGVTAKDYSHAQYFNGSEDALVSAEIVQREWLPGKPGNNKYSIRLVLEGDKYRMLADRYARVPEGVVEIAIKRVKKDGYIVTKFRSASEQECFKRTESLKEALDKESRALSDLPFNSEGMREESLRLATRFLVAIGIVLTDPKANGGYAFGPEFLTEMDIGFKQLLDAIRAHTIYFHADERNNQIVEIKRRTVEIDPEFSAFMSSTLALAKASISSGKMAG